ncbi:hypothetical protein BH23BAC4_BH23BAC4_09670 [soil metagenome]
MPRISLNELRSQLESTFSAAAGGKEYIVDLDDGRAVRLVRAEERPRTDAPAMRVGDIDAPVGVQDPAMDITPGEVDRAMSDLDNPPPHRDL